jgi:3-oxoacyl-[acyl-carrier protein] reductase
VDLGLTGKRAAVAASSAGLGLAAARALAAEAVRVTICGRDKARLDAAAETLRGAGDHEVAHSPDRWTLDAAHHG